MKDKNTTMKDRNTTLKGKEESKEKGRDKGKESYKEDILVRILSTDIPGGKQILAGLTRIKGVGWTLSNAVCNTLGIDKTKKIKDLSKEDINKISTFIKKPKLPSFLLNRRKDLETGEDRHLVSSDLDLRKEFDIKRLKKIKSYKGFRHATGRPVRGQRTRSHFRKNKTVGVTKKKKK